MTAAASGSSEPCAAVDGEIEPASVTTRPALSPSSTLDGLMTSVIGLGEPGDVRAIAIVRCVSCGLTYAAEIVRICRACEREHPRPNPAREISR